MGFKGPMVVMRLPFKKNSPQSRGPCLLNPPCPFLLEGGKERVYYSDEVIELLLE